MPVRAYNNSSATIASFRRRALTCACALIAAVAGCGGWSLRTPRASNWNVLLVTLDTTRADRIGAYGYAGAETPTLDRLAREGVLFEQADSAAPLTLPAHSSLFTGRFPPRHGVRDNGGFFLDPKQVTLASVLRDHAFHTGAFVGAYVLDSKWGLNSGFDTYYDKFDLSKHDAISLGSIRRPANEVVDHALEWLQSAADTRFFCWVHFYDPHAPYDPPEPFRSRLPQRPYDGEIAFTDSQLGRLVAFLESRHLLDRTLIVVVGDHGESLGQHREDTHGFFVYESVLRIPLIVRTPLSNSRGRRIADVVRSVDVMPTVLDLLGIRKPADVDGTSLVPAITTGSAPRDLETYSETYYSRHHYGWSELLAMRQDRYKVIDAPRPELYDLTSDPEESCNLYDDRRNLADRMLGRLHQRSSEFTTTGAAAAPPKTEIDPDARERLAALGYIGTFTSTTTSPGSGSRLADPKDKVDIFNLMTRAHEGSRQNANDGFVEAVSILKRVVRDDPTVIDAWAMLGNQYVKANRTEESLEFFTRALALKPDYDIALVNLANAYRRLGRDEEALVGYQRFLEIDPKNPQIRYQVAQIEIDRGEVNAAENQLREALRLQPDMAAARNALGVVALRRGDRAAADREIRAALAENADVRLAHFNLGVLAEDRNDIQTAISEYEQEIARHAQSYKAAVNLGNAYGRVRNRVAQREAYRKAIAMNPHFADGYFILAKVLLDDRAFDEAASMARKGLAVSDRSELAPLGHYVIADIEMHEGRATEAAREVQIGRALEARRAQNVR